MRRARSLTAVAAALALVVGASAARAATSPMVAVQGNGNVATAWLEGAPTITERTWAAGGGLTEPQYVSALRRPIGGRSLGVDGAGRATFAWTQPSGNVSTVHARRRGADGSLGPLLQVSTAAYHAYSVEVAVNAAGDAVIVWWRQGTSDQFIMARRLSASGTLGPTLTLSAAGRQSRRPAVAIAPDGGALVVWDGHPTGPGIYQVKCRKIRPDSTLGSIQGVSGGIPLVEGPQVAMDGAGNAMIAWIPHYEHEGYRDRIDMRRRSASGTLSPYTDTVAESTSWDARNLKLAVNAGGAAMFAWIRIVNNHQEIQARYLRVDGTYGNVLTLSDPADDFHTWQPQVGIDAQGNSLVAWERIVEDGVHYRLVQARRRSATGVVGGIETVAGEPFDGPEAVNPVLGMAPGGTATIAWEDGLDPDTPASFRRIVARRRSPAGSYGAPVRLDGP